MRNYEQGIRLPAFPIVVKLAVALGVDCTAFADAEDVNPDEAIKLIALRPHETLEFLEDDQDDQGCNTPS